MPKVSIIVPVYNAEPYLAACVESILRQTFADWELILVDDGSADRSGQLCEKYAAADPRVHALRRANGGVSRARNTGLDAATGEYVTFVDADDQLLPGFLARFSYDGLCFEAQGFTVNHVGHTARNTTVTFARTRTAHVKDVYAESEWLRLSRGPCCKMFRRDIIGRHAVRYPEGISFGEDALFVKRYLAHCDGPARSIAAADYLYNQYDKSQSLTHKAHPAQVLYDVAWADWQLYGQLAARWGAMPDEVDRDFRRVRALEFYWSVVACMREPGRDAASRRRFVAMARAGMFPHIKAVSPLPPTYHIVRFCLASLPGGLAARALTIVCRAIGSPRTRHDNK